MGRGSARAASRPPPIGTRPSAPDVVGSRLFASPLTEPLPLAVLLEQLFPGAPAAALEDAERYFRTIPPWRWLTVRDFLVTIPPEFRLQMFATIMAPDGGIPDLEHLPPDVQKAIGYVPISERRPGATVYGPGPIYGAMPGPAMQQVCIVNGFDPRWGTPPSSYLGVAMAFDPSKGYYAFDRSYALKNSVVAGTDRAAYTTWDFNSVEKTYVSGWAVQPFRTSIASPWQFRWVIRSATPTVTCV